MVQASKMMGHTRRLLFHPKHKQDPIQLSRDAAVRLTDAIDLDNRKYLSNEERVEIIQDLQFVIEEFFKAIENQ